MSISHSLYRLPTSQQEDLAQLRQMITQFIAGEIDAPSLKAFHVPLGIYEQRENESYMLRVRLPAGMVLPEHMCAVARVGRSYGDGQLHFTSRQELQVHGVPLASIYPALLELAEAGLSGKGGGGNTVRNIAACPHAGVCPHETFDITPHVVGLTESLLSDPHSFQLPRKYKIAFSGCGQDCAAATVNDLGFISKIRDGVEGFAVYIGGGMGAHSRVGVLLEDFIPGADVYRVAEAVKRVFDQHGNRQDRHRARLRFLIEELGIDRFKELYVAERASLQSIAPTITSIVTSLAETTSAPLTPLAGFARWRDTQVQPQRQQGYFTVEISPTLGMIDAEKLIALAGITERYGERMLRATSWQGVLLRWVREEQLPALHAELSALDLGTGKSLLLRRMVCCTGASTCRLGICLSRELADAIITTLTDSSMDLAGDATVHISGCPNACGRHPLALIGFYGVIRRVNEQRVPHYVLQLGGHVEEGKSRLAEGATAIPACNIPAFLLELLHAFYASPQHPHFAAFLTAGGVEIAEQLAQRHLHV